MPICPVARKPDCGPSTGACLALCALPQRASEDPGVPFSLAPGLDGVARPGRPHPSAHSTSLAPGLACRVREVVGVRPQCTCTLLTASWVLATGEPHSAR